MSMRGEILKDLRTARKGAFAEAAPLLSVGSAGRTGKIRATVAKICGVLHPVSFPVFGVSSRRRVMNGRSTQLRPFMFIFGRNEP